jgi:hypothetical protein
MSGERDRDGTEDDGLGPLVRVVERQRRENEHLRTAMRSRAVIEQAKGILVARTGADPESAFQELVAHSQRSNRKLIQVAAELVAHSIRAPGRGGAEERRHVLDEASAWDPSTLVTAAAVVAAPDLNELLQAIIQHTRRIGVTAGMLALAEPDGALRIVGVYGYEPHVVSGWQRLPPGDDLPLTAAAEHREAQWFGDRAERERRFPTSDRFPGHREACVVVPLEASRQLVGVLCLDWDEPSAITEASQRVVMSVAELCAEPVARLLRSYTDELPGVDMEPGRSEWFWSFLDNQPTAQLVLSPHLEGDELVDAEVVYANGIAQRVTGLAAGVSMLEQAPALVGGHLLDVVAEVARTGTASDLSDFEDGAERQVFDPAGSVAVSRLGTSVVLSWGART